MLDGRKAGQTVADLTTHVVLHEVRIPFLAFVVRLIPGGHSISRLAGLLSVPDDLVRKRRYAKSCSFF
jgi:DNA-binding protein Fis